MEKGWAEGLCGRVREEGLAPVMKGLKGGGCSMGEPRGWGNGIWEVEKREELT